MVKEVYFISVISLDAEYGELEKLSGKEYVSHPTSEEIAQAISDMSGDFAKVNKRFKVVS